MTTLSSIAEVLQSLARRNKLQAKITLGILVVLGLFGVSLLSVAFSTQDVQRQVVLVGGGLLVTMILLLYTLIRNLQKQMKMVVALIDRIQEQTAIERLLGPIGARAAKTDTADGPLKDILNLAQHLDKRQRRSFMATTVGLLGAAWIAATILGRSSYVDVERTIALMAVRSQEPEQGASELERVRGLPPQEKEETQPPKDEPMPGGERTLQAGGETQQAMQEPRVAPEQLVALRGQVGALQQELSATRQKLQQERQKAAVLEEGTRAYGKGAGELQKRIEGLEGTSAKQDYVRLLNEALAYTYRNSPGDAERAETAYRSAIRIAQDKSIRDPVVYNAYAAFLQEQGRFREAEQFYQKALEINPRYGPALFNLGSLYERTGRMEEALKKYKAADEAGEKLGAQEYQRLQSIVK